MDRSLWDEMGGFKPTGVNPRLVEKVRGALDGAGFTDVRIVVSGGFTADRIREFEATGRRRRRLRRRLIADPRPERLHRRRRAARRPARARRSGAHGYAPNLRRAGRQQVVTARSAEPSAGILRGTDAVLRSTTSASPCSDIDASVAGVLPGRSSGMPLVHRETVAEQGVDAALLDVGDGHIELLQPLGPDTAVGKFLSRRGPGLHHVAYRVAVGRRTRSTRAPPPVCA